MIRIYYKLILIGVLAIYSTSCTSDFEKLNTDSFKVSDAQLEADFNGIGSFFPQMIRGIYHPSPAYQTAQNLDVDSWVGYLATPTDFSGGANNTTYKIIWPSSLWDSTYKDLMAPSEQVMKLTEESEDIEFETWAKLLRIYGIQRVASKYGPVIYSRYGEEGTVSYYDSEEEFYTKVFEDIDDIVAILSDRLDFMGYINFDVSSYNGDISKWVKLANSTRLMLALRLVDVAPELARNEAEKAVKQSIGVFESNADSFIVDGGSDGNPLALFSFVWQDTRMAATMESFLVGYKDPRLSAYFEPITGDASELVPDHPDFPFKGVKSGAEIKSKDERLPFSTVTKDFERNPNYPVLTYSDVCFMLAEAKLRNWDLGSRDQSSKQFYEDGIRASFEQWNVGGVEEYINDGHSQPIDYSDPVVKDPRINSFQAQTDITIKWDENSTNERKLERIITQKWISGYPNSYKAWNDFRRTGYPAIEPVYNNLSDASDGIIPDGEFIKRLRFIESEYQSNPEGVEDAIQKLGGPDEIGTRLWWDINKPNF